jgi:hypothetical protein
MSPAHVAGRRSRADFQRSVVGSPSAAGLQVPRRIPGQRSTAPTRLKGLDATAAGSWVADVEEADGGPPASEKNGGAPRRAAMVPVVKLGCAAVEGPARPGDVVAAMKE